MDRKEKHIMELKLLSLIKSLDVPKTANAICIEYNKTHNTNYRYKTVRSRLDNLVKLSLIKKIEVGNNIFSYEKSK